MATEKNTKKHADFQDTYRRSSNFNNSKKEEHFEIKKNGKLKLEQQEHDDLDETEKKRIEDAMESFEKRTEITPNNTDDKDS